MKRNISLMLAVLLAFGAAACDTAGEQNIDWSAGEALTIVGAAEVDAGATEDYYVGAYSIEREYTWSVEGPGASLVGVPRGEDGRDDEFASVTFPEAGTYTIQVQTEIDGEPYSGALEVVATPAE